MNSKKLNLKTLEVQSFITKIGTEAKTIIGADVGSDSCGAPECRYPKPQKITLPATGAYTWGCPSCTLIAPACQWSGYDNC